MISFKNVNYNIKNKIILSNVNFNIKESENVLIVGNSGSGKTTIFNLILNNIKASSGSIYYKKEDIDLFNKNKLNDYRLNEISIIYQKDELFDNLTVFDNLNLFYETRDIDNILKKAKLSHLKNRYIYSLSGGERQRIAILKVLLSNFNVLLCDEITSALDHNNASKIIDFILKMAPNKTIIFISHDESLFINKIDKIITIKNKTIDSINIINDININKVKSKIKNKKSIVNISIKDGLKKINLANLLIYIVLLISFNIAFNFKDISFYFASSSYKSYFNYDVLSIIDNKDIKANNVDIFNDLTNDFMASSLKINDNSFYNIRFLPFNNYSNKTNLVINNLLLENNNLKDIKSISLKGNINYQSNKVDIINEDNIFSHPCIYYDILYFSKLYEGSSNNLIIINYDFTKLDKRFTNNPMYEIKNEDKPYLDSNAYKDYLTFMLVFSSIYSITNMFFIIILIFSIIITILINISIILKDIKKIAIFKNEGYSNLNIIISYLIPIFSYFILTSFIYLFFNDVISILLTFLIECISLFISYYYISKKNLNTLLKEDYLC